ncbi:MAG: hypothetical protein PHV13_02985 [Candidatus ainarchaeum sp.]|nr:hypothetical protein [Candidatus ainarchaeum sp.]
MFTEERRPLLEELVKMELSKADLDELLKQPHSVSFNGQTRVTKAGQVAAILLREGPNTPIEIDVDGDPLTVRYTVATGDKILSTRPPASEEEHEAARQANLKRMGKA